MQYRIKGDGRKRVFPAFDPGQTEQPFHQTGNPGILFFNCIQEGAVIQAVLYAGGVHADEGNRRFDVMGHIIQKLFHLPVFIKQLLFIFTKGTAHLVHVLCNGFQFISCTDIQNGIFLTGKLPGKVLHLPKRIGNMLYEQAEQPPPRR